MAKLHSYYVLCPLIDQKSFLGITGDKKRGEVLVTLGRNVVNKYRLSDQKQTGGWSSKEHITAAVIFDILQESYVGVFNNNTIKLWKDSDNVDKVKKFKLPQNILKLIPREENTYLVFSNGNTASLPYAVENRKSIQVHPVLKANEVIIDSDCYSQDSNHIVYFTKNEKRTHEIITCPLREELGDIVIAKLMRTKVCRPDEDVNIIGHLINVKSKCPRVYILWSDSKLIVYDLQKKLWKTVGKVPWISTQSSVSMWPLGDTHLILFGSNTNQDGAIIMVYDLSLGIGSCQYPMKMYSKNAKLFISENYIILETTNHIGVLSYMLETKRNLSMLLGTHEIVEDGVTEIANWDTPSEPLFNVKPEFKNLLSQGLSERAICSQVLPQLVEKKDISEILEVLKQFKDIPESAIVHTLNFILKTVNINVDIIDAEEFAKFCTKNDSEFQSKLKLLNTVFQVPFSDALLIPYLRNGLSLDDALFLMTYISYLLFESDLEFDIEYESKLLDWCTLLMDAFYQQYLMTKDDKVTYALGNMLHVVASLIEQLGEVDNTLPLLHKVLAGKSIITQESRTPYAIELMEI